LERSHTNMRNVANHLSLALTCPASKIFIWEEIHTNSRNMTNHVHVQKY
jgi:hypothetical protein